MGRKYTSTMWKEVDRLVEKNMDTDSSGPRKSEEMEPVGRDKVDEPNVESPSSSETRSCEDVFGENQGQLVFLEDPDAPTVDEWAGV